MMSYLRSNFDILGGKFDKCFIGELFLDCFLIRRHIYSKGVFPIQTATNKYYQGIQHVGISLGTNLHLKQVVLVLRSNLPKEDISCSKQDNLN